MSLGDLGQRVQRGHLRSQHAHLVTRPGNVRNVYRELAGVLKHPARKPRQRFFNLVVTNIPGPQFPLYVLGREMKALFPMVPLARQQAVCVGIMSYNGQIHFGLIGDYDAMADLDSLALDLEAAIADLSAAAPKRKRPKARRAPKKSPAKGQKAAEEAKR